MIKFFRRSRATIFVFFIVSLVLMGGGSSDPCLPQDPTFWWLLVALECAFEGESLDSICDCLASGTSALSEFRADGPPMHFEWNLGQTDRKYGFVSRTARGYSVFLSSSESLVELPSASLRASLIGARADVNGEPEKVLPGRVNYLLGSDPNRWITDVPTFERIRYREIYPGIDVIYYGNGTRVEHDFIVAPGAQTDPIRFRFEGAGKVSQNADGDLAIAIGKGELLWKKPVIYQVDGRGARRPVQGRYRQFGDGTVGFELGAYDPKRALVIDPEIQFASYLGGRNNDLVGRVAVDTQGNVYVTGVTNDSQFPVSPGAFRTPPGTVDRNDAIVSKFRSDGSSLVYSTYIGGQASDAGGAIAVDSSGNVYLTGVTRSPEFPTTAGAIQRQPGSQTTTERNRADCFVAKLNAAGNALVYSTLLGGRELDACTSIAVDAAGNAYVTGTSASPSFPTTGTAFQPQIRFGFAPFDGFAAKIDPSGSALVYSTFLGGNGNDIPTSIAIDAGGNAYVAGTTNSNAGFPVSAGAFQPRYQQEGALFNRGRWDAFVVKLNPTGAGLTYGTYLGGGRTDTALGLAVDAQGSAYVCGNTLSTDFPVTASAYQRAFRGAGGQFEAGLAAGDAFATKLNPSGTALVYSTFLGGSRDDRALACALDATGALHVAGHTLSTDFPVTADGQQRTFGGKSATNLLSAGDAFYLQLDPQGRDLLYSTYYGGSDEDAALGLAVDAAGSAYVSGATASPNLTTTANAAQKAYGGGLTLARAFFFGDGFIAKYSGGAAVEARPSIAALVSAASYAGGGVAPGEITLLNGVSIGPAGLTTLVLTAATTVATTLAETRVLFDDIPAPLIYVSAGQSSAIVPYEMARLQSARVVVEYRGARSVPVVVPILSAKPALFSANASGRGPGAIQNEDLRLNTPDNPSAKGRIVILYGTGEGQTNPPGTNGLLAVAVFPKPVLPVSVMIGGRTADVLYAGAAPSLVAGLLQINAKIPEDVPSGNLDVIVTVGSARSQSGLTVAVR